MTWLRSDDIDGSVEDVQALDLGFEGQVYVLHLGPSNRAALRAALMPWLKGLEPRRPMGITTDHSPQAKATGARSRPATSRRDRVDSRPNLAEIREWATANGYPHKPLGRIPKYILAAYDAKHPSTDS